jgi:hypothetical protein
MLSPGSRQELLWWIHNVEICNGKPIRFQDPVIVITTDASKKRLGSDEQSEGFRQVDTGGNFLAHKCIGVTSLQYAILTLVPELTSRNIQLQIDNSSAVAYIDHMGGAHSKPMNSIAKEIWDWAIQRNIHLTAVHIPEIEHVKADIF